MKMLILVLLSSLVLSSLAINSLRNSWYPLWRGGGFQTMLQTPLFVFHTSSPMPPTPSVDSYNGRLQIYKALIEAVPMSAAEEVNSGIPSFDESGLHFLWGYAAQLEWQCRSLRLAYPDLDSSHISYPDTADDYKDRIHPESWWGRMNFALCVPIFIAAERANIKLPYRVSDFNGAYIDTVEEYECVIEMWTAIWETIVCRNETSEGSYRDTEIDHLRRSIWEAHMSTLDVALNINKRFYTLLPPAEQVFAKGWIRFVDILAAARWRTDILAIQQEGAGYLPNRVLTGNAPIDIKEIEIKKGRGEVDSEGQSLIVDSASRLREAATVASTLQLGQTSEPIFQLQIQFFATVCRRYEARQKFAGILRALLFRHETDLWWTNVFYLIWLYIQGAVATLTAPTDPDP